MASIQLTSAAVIDRCVAADRFICGLLDGERLATADRRRRESDRVAEYKRDHPIRAFLFGNPHQRFLGFPDPQTFFLDVDEEIRANLLKSRLNRIRKLAKLAAQVDGQSMVTLTSEDLNDLRIG